MFSFLDHLLSLAAHDDAFAAKSAQHVENIFRAKMEKGRKSMVLKWKQSVLDLPVFRGKIRTPGESGTSPTEPLRAGTWRGYLKRLGLKAGFQYPLTQYGLRRGLLDAVNGASTPFLFLA